MNKHSSVADGTPTCPICGQHLLVRLARGRKSGKPFVMLICSQDGRHFRGFINHIPYVTQVLDNLEASSKGQDGGVR